MRLFFRFCFLSYLIVLSGSSDFIRGVFYLNKVVNVRISDYGGIEEEKF